MRRAAQTALAMLALACSVEPSVTPQVLVRVETDANIPELGDRLLVEGLAPNGELACENCRRVFGVGNAAAFPLSFGVTPEAGVTHVRARLFRNIIAGSGGEPEGRALIDFVGRLPHGSGRPELELALSVACFGRPADPASELTCLPEQGELGMVPELKAAPAGALRPGNSPLAAASACPELVPDGAVCIPGGLLILGAPGRAEDPVTAPFPEHLVRVSTFLLDREELTVGTFRALIPDLPDDELPTIQAPDPNAIDGACTYVGPDDPTHDDLPLNCVTHGLATRVCAALGKRLPAEAEWELAAGNGGDETAFTWGRSGEEACYLAVVGRGRDYPPVAGEDPGCLDATSDYPGPVAHGSSSDVTALGVMNLGGNASEFVADAFAAFDDACWTRDGAPLDPRCDAATRAPLDAISVRGGSWAGSPESALVNRRGWLDRAASNPYTGFRCAADVVK